MFLILPLILVPAWKTFRKYFIHIFGVLIGVSAVATFVSCYRKGYIVETAVSDM